MQFPLVALFLAAVGVCAAGAAQADSTGLPPGPTVTIGVPLPLSGDLQAFGIMMKNSFDMAKEAINKEGGIKGRPLNLVYVDDRGKAVEGVKAVTSLVRESKVAMLVGGYASSATYAMAEQAERLDTPFLICTASADKITQRGWKNIFRLNPPISEYTKGLEDFWIKNFKPTSMAVVYENSMFGTDGMRRMMEFCQSNAVELKGLIPYDRTKADPTYFRPFIAGIMDDIPDVIYMISYLKDAVALVKTIRAMGIKSMLCGGAAGFTHEDFLKEAGNDANLLFTATLWFHNLPYPGAEQYYSRYQQLYSATPDYHGAEAFSALIVAADALKRAKSPGPSALREALKTTFIVTPFGPVKFYSYYDFDRQNSVRTQVLQIIDGKYQCVWPPDLATASFVPTKR